MSLPMMKVRGKQKGKKSNTYETFAFFVLFASTSSIFRRTIGEQCLQTSMNWRAIDMPIRHCGMRHMPYELFLKIDVTNKCEAICLIALPRPQDSYSSSKPGLKRP